MAIDTNNINYHGFESSWSAVIKMSNLTFLHGRRTLEPVVNEFVQEHFEKLEQELYCLAPLHVTWIAEKLRTAWFCGWKGEQLIAVKRLLREGPQKADEKTLTPLEVQKSLFQTFLLDEAVLTQMDQRYHQNQRQPIQKV